MHRHIFRKYLSKNEFLSITILTYLSGAQMGSIHENKCQKILWHCQFCRAFVNISLFSMMKWKRKSENQLKAQCYLNPWEEGSIQKIRQRSLLLFGDRIYALPCRTSYFAPERFWRRGWGRPFLQIILVQFIIFFKSSWCKIAGAAKNLINSVPKTAATTFTFSSVFILLLRVNLMENRTVGCTFKLKTKDTLSQK